MNGSFDPLVFTYVGRVGGSGYAAGMARQLLPFLGSLKLGDDRIDRTLVVERKTLSDFAAPVIEGRLFTQASKLAGTTRTSKDAWRAFAELRPPSSNPQSGAGHLFSMNFPSQSLGVRVGIVAMRGAGFSNWYAAIRPGPTFPRTRRRH